MLSLIIKDLRLSAKVSILALAFPIIISLGGLYMDIPACPINMMYILSILMISYFSIMFSNAYDHKNKSEIVLNSLPIGREEIVKGKYMLPLIYSMIYFFLFMLITNVFILLGAGGDGKPAGIWDLVVVMNLLLIFYSLYYPAYFKSENGLAGLNQFIYILIILGPSLLKRFGGVLIESKMLRPLMGMNIKRGSIILLMVTCITYYISLQVSKTIYLRKEI